MDLRFSQEYEAFRAEVRAFLDANWPPKGADAELPREEGAQRFRERAIEAGYACRSIPKKYGGSEQDPDVLKATIIGEEFTKKHAPLEVRGIGPSMLVPTLLEHGEEWQKELYVPPTIRGEMVWCQGYSEPGSGSDLASLKTRAVLDGDTWVINGQKIWTTSAHIADMMFCLCRTEPDQPKHGGISYILIDMKTPGIDVRPLRQMIGQADFNEVFFDDVRVPAKNIVGKRGEGWIVSRSTLKHERNMIGDAGQAKMMLAGLIGLAKKTQRNGKPAIEDSGIRQRLAELEGYVQSHVYSGYRQLTSAARGEDPGIVQRMNKLVSTTIGQNVAKLSVDILGDDTLVAPSPDIEMMRGFGDNSGWVAQYFWSLGIAIAGGTANIQRNVIAERGLGLPRDAAADQHKQ